MTLQECIDAWNEQADEYNQWPSLDGYEMSRWCLKMASQEIDKLSQENASLCSILDEVANEFMDGDGEGRFVYPKRPGLARLVNEILKL